MPPKGKKDHPKGSKAEATKASTAKARPRVIRCTKCKETFSTAYSLKRHVKRKNLCGKKSVAQREALRKEKRKLHNRTYYCRKKWGISLTSLIFYYRKSQKTLVRKYELVS